MINTLGQYLKEIGQYKLLTAEEELELGKRISEGDEVARETLINSNLRLVVNIAKVYYHNNSNMDFEDLISAGNIGLITAVDKFDYTRNFRFSTCAVPWIKQAITKVIIDESRTIRIPPHIIQLFSKEKKAIESLAFKGNANPTDEQIAKEIGITLDKYQSMREWKQNTISLDTPLSDEGEADTLMDICPDTVSISPEKYADQSNLKIFIRKKINELDNRTKQIIKLRFGLGEAGDAEEYFNEHTLEEIGTFLTPTLTRERVRQILVKQLTTWKNDNIFNN